jgi:TPR repeat protein
MDRMALFFAVALIGGSSAWSQKIDPETDFASNMSRAKAGDLAAQIDVGKAYLSGLGVSPDLDEAEKWFRRAADHDSSTAQFHLGMICEEKSHGGKFPQFQEEAVKWWSKAAEQGNRQACWKLGQAYAEGTGVVKDDVQAYKWLSLALTRFGTEGARWDLENISKRMTPDQISAAQKLSAEFKARPHLEQQKSK